MADAVQRCQGFRCDKGPGLEMAQQLPTAAHKYAVLGRYDQILRWMTVAKRTNADEHRFVLSFEPFQRMVAAAQPADRLGP
ncbi:hypothetical protein C8N30_2938 [Sulfitobacter guttiformis]|uniref:Uncharacterized protein n=1 Tax=Sulfitobacter guttiformis TaxID=74349 RepID=A0A420DHZ3_9RHOB|nr:hypothetical protein C8N30_2938 [Sulfitobacter guttiformis]